MARSTKTKRSPGVVEVGSGRVGSVHIEAGRFDGERNDDDRCIPG
jgi:hypothetical protein